MEERNTIEDGPWILSRGIGKNPPLDQTLVRGPKHVASKYSILPISGPTDIPTLETTLKILKARA